MNWLTRIFGFLAAYSLLYYRPELFIPASKAIGRSALETFLIVWLWTTFLTALTYWSPDVVKKIIHLAVKIFQKLFKCQASGLTVKKAPFYEKWFITVWIKALSQKFQNFSHRTVKKIVLRSPYLLFITFAFPVIPSLDTASVIALRLLRVRLAFWLLILINTVKFLIIIALCYGWFK